MHYKILIPNKKEKIFKINPVKHSKNWGNSWSQWQKPNTPEMNFIVYSPKDQILDFKVKKENKKRLYSSLVKMFTKVLTKLNMT